MMISNFDFSIVKELVYDKCAFEIKNFVLEKESKEYNACSFKINNFFGIARGAKITPAKTGQFVFPKSELVKQGIISTDRKDRKRGLSAYPSWDKANSKQAEKTQK